MPVNIEEKAIFTLRSWSSYTFSHDSKPSHDACRPYLGIEIHFLWFEPFFEVGEDILQCPIGNFLWGWEGYSAMPHWELSWGWGGYSAMHHLELSWGWGGYSAMPLGNCLEVREYTLRCPIGNCLEVERRILCNATQLLSQTCLKLRNYCLTLRHFFASNTVSNYAIIVSLRHFCLKLRATIVSNYVILYSPVESLYLRALAPRPQAHLPEAPREELPLPGVYVYVCVCVFFFFLDVPFWKCQFGYTLHVVFIVTLRSRRVTLVVIPSPVPNYAITIPNYCPKLRNRCPQTTQSLSPNYAITVPKLRHCYPKIPNCAITVPNLRNYCPQTTQLLSPNYAFIIILVTLRSRRAVKLEVIPWQGALSQRHTHSAFKIEPWR